MRPEMWEIEYEQREAEAYERHLNEQYDAWAQAHECVDVAAHHLRARRRSLGPAAFVPAAWLLTHPEAPIRCRLLTYDRSEMLGDIADF